MDKSFALLAAGRIFLALLSFALIKVLTICLSADQVGMYFFFLAINGYFGLVLINPIGMYLMRKLNNWKNQAVLSKALWYFVLYLTAVSLLTLPLFLILKFLKIVSPETYLISALVLTGFVFANSFNNTILPVLNMIHRRASFVLLSVLTQIVSILVSYLMIKFFEPTATYWLMGQVFGFLSLGLIGFFYLDQCISEKPQKLTLNFLEIRKFATPLVLTNICVWILTQSYRPIIKSFIGLEFLGFIGLGLGLASSIAVSFEYIFQQYFFPDFYKQIETDDKSQRVAAWQNLYNNVLYFYVSMAFFITFFAPFIMRVLADPKFISAYLFLVYGIWIEFFRINANLVALISHSEMRTKAVLKPYFWGALVALGSLCLIIQFPSLKNLIPVAVLMGNIVVFVALIRKFSKSYVISFDRRKILKTVAYALPYPLVFFLYPAKESLLVSFIILAIFGGYFLYSQAKIYQKQLF